MRRFGRTLEVNVTGVFNATQVFGQAMCEAGGGSIVNIGSLYASVAPIPAFYDHIDPPFTKPAAYGASKAAVVNLTRYFARLWGPLRRARERALARRRPRRPGRRVHPQVLRAGRRSAGWPSRPTSSVRCSSSPPTRPRTSPARSCASTAASRRDSAGLPPDLARRQIRCRRSTRATSARGRSTTRAGSSTSGRRTSLPGDLRRPEAAERLRAPAERSDILRLELLWREGGVYVDTDFECLRSIEPLLDGARLRDRAREARTGEQRAHRLGRRPSAPRPGARRAAPARVLRVRQGCRRTAVPRPRCWPGIRTRSRSSTPISSTREPPAATEARVRRPPRGAQLEGARRPRRWTPSARERGWRSAQDELAQDGAALRARPGGGWRRCARADRTAAAGRRGRRRFPRPAGSRRSASATGSGRCGPACSAAEGG